MEERLITLLKTALFYHASDIHLTLKNNFLFIEMRIGNKLKIVKSKSGDEKLIRYLQYISKLDVGNNLEPQTGRFNIEIDNKNYSIRFAYMHDLNIINGVIRILNNCINYRLDELNINKDEIKYFDEILTMQDGLVVFSGPTGSGKTTTIYSILNNMKERKIITIEDPIEVYSDKYLQLQINEKIAWDYNQAIKQIMRHDPDVIMIGEIRDEIATDAALRAANTGHLVITSIHASSCEMAINRLLELGLNKNNLKIVLRQVYNQRLFFKDNKSYRRIGVYEIMGHDEIKSFFKDETSYSSIGKLQRKIDEAINKKAIINY